MNRISVFYANVLDAVKHSGLPLKTVLADIAEAGIEALDIDYTQIKDGLPEKNAESGLAVNTVYAFFDLWKDGAYDEAKRVIDTAMPLGAAVMFVPEKLPKDAIFSLKGLKDEKSVFSWLDSCDAAVKTAQALEKLSVYGNSLGVPVGVENFDSDRSLTERKFELQWLFAKAPHLLFNLDTGNSVFCGEDINELYSLFREKIMNVHCKDRKTVDGKLCSVAVGEGDMPIAEIKNSLEQSGYSGRYSIEVFGVTDAYSAIISSAEYLKRSI